MELRQNESEIAAWLAVQAGIVSPDELATARLAMRQAHGSPGIMEWLERSSLVACSERRMLEDMASQLMRLRGGIDSSQRVAFSTETEYTATLGSGGGWGEGKTLADGPATNRNSPSTDQAGVPDSIDGSGELTQECCGRYELREQIGEGGQAKVLLAVDRHMGREIAWKEMLWGGQWDSGQVSRFLREARITAALEHPNIVPVHEVGRRADGSLYYTMRLVRGETLQKKVESCKTLEERLKLVVPFWDVCNAVAFAHKRGIIHRDLKPGNIMVGEFGQTVLLDWGLAKKQGTSDGECGGPQAAPSHGGSSSHEGSADRTVSGTALGTPQYMSPEQALGQIDKVDERSDVWGLGAVLYKILTGRAPFRATSDCVQRTTKGQPRPVLEACPEAPAELAAIAGKALQLDRENRYADARQLAEDVAAYMTGRRVGAHEYSSWELLRRFAKRNRAAMVAAGLVFSVIVVALGVVMVAYRREATAHQQEAVARQREHDARLRAHYQLAEAYAKQAEWLAGLQDGLNVRVLAAASLVNNPAYPESPHYNPEFASGEPHSQWLWIATASLVDQAKHGQVTRFLRTLHADAAVDRVLFSPDGLKVVAADHTGVVYVWNLRDGGELARFRARANAPTAIALSPDGKEIATSTDDATIEVRQLMQPQAVRRLSQLQARATGVAYSPDGRMLAVKEQGGRGSLISPATGRIVGRLSSQGEALSGIDFSPDGRWLVYADYEDTYVCDGHDGRLVRTLRRSFGPTFSPDSGSLATRYSDKTVQLWEVASGQRRAIIPCPTNPYSVRFSPDGSRLAITSQDAMVRFWDAAGSQILSSIKGHSELVYSVAFSPDGRVIASGSDDRTVRLWEWTTHGGLVHLAHDGLARAVAYSPDGRTIATGDYTGAARLWDAASGDLVKELWPHANDVTSLAFSPDGTLLAYNGPDDSVVLFDIVHGVERLRLSGHMAPVWFAFSPDGTTLVSTGEDRTARLWDVSSGKEIAVLIDHGDQVYGADFSPDSSLLATSCNDHLVRLWDARTRKLSGVLSGHTDWVSSVRFSPDGRFLFSAGKDHNVIQWEVASGAQVRNFVGHKRWVNRGVVSTDGQLLATADDNGLAVVWDIASGKSLQHVKMPEGIDGISLAPNRQKLALTNGRAVILYPIEVPQTRDANELLREAETAAGMTLKNNELVPTDGQ